MQLLLLAKAPVPGRVKTRMCPPASAAQAATIAAAALADTVDALSATPAAGRTIVLSGRYPTPPGWRTATQRGNGLAERLVHAYADTAVPHTATLLVGMDTPQLTPALLRSALSTLDGGADAALGPTEDGGWWTLGLRDPAHAQVLRGVPMSTPRTLAYTVEALRARGLTVNLLGTLRDVDTVADAHAVAALCPHGRFAAAIRSHLPDPARPVR